MDQISEEETCTKYNYEEFVRVLSKEEIISNKPKKIKEIENEEYQKEFLINSTCSSDITSISNSQTENLSQTSENIFPLLNSISDGQKETEINEKKLDYFYGIENYFRKIYPEKFNEYKNSRNFLPKKRMDINNKYQSNKSQITMNNSEQNKMNNNASQFGNNLYYYPINGNIIYCIYNNFYFNFLNTQIQSANKNEINKNNENKEINTKQEEEKQQNKIENINKIKNVEKNISDKIEDEYNNIYIIKKKNYKNNNNGKNNKTNNYKIYQKEMPSEKRQKEKDYNYNYNYQYYNNKNNYNYNNNDSYNNFNGNYEKRKKKYYIENNYHKKKYFKRTYY